MQARHFAEQLTSLAGELPGAADNDASPVRLGPLLPLTPRDGLSACIGLEGSTPAVIDLVADGPHAVVAGMTGSGKSELLVSWVLALCAGRSPREVSLLLADFKGGTAFDALAALPHVTGVITDLDGAGARRAIQSLRAEVRWREGELARVGARDIRDPRVELSRLVVVVDEFAALLGDHPELHAVFTDIAARGRALGMHLVLGTQRVSGVVRDALLANCPLRVSLRVADAADSRAVIGTDEAARISGGASTRGVALVRRSADSAPRRIRVALSDPGDVAAIAAGVEGQRPRRPWLPELPERVELDDLLSAPPAEHGADLVLGLADDPDHQRQTPIGVRIEDRGVLILGATGTGRTTALQTLGAQARRTILVPPDPEQAWDEVARLSDDRPPHGAVILLDDVDALVSRYPHEYAHEFLARLERVIRAAGGEPAARRRLRAATRRSRRARRGAAAASGASGRGIPCRLPRPRR